MVPLSPKPGSVESLVGVIKAQSSVLASLRDGGLVTLRVADTGSGLVGVAGWSSAHEAAAAAPQLGAILAELQAHLAAAPGATLAG
eukprot:5060110-Prymnesium_polylepis.1